MLPLLTRASESVIRDFISRTEMLFFSQVSLFPLSDSLSVSLANPFSPHSPPYYPLTDSTFLFSLPLRIRFFLSLALFLRSCSPSLPAPTFVPKYPAGRINALQIHRYFFQRDSPVFEAMFSLPPPLVQNSAPVSTNEGGNSVKARDGDPNSNDCVEGQTDGRPIVLNGVFCTDLDRLLAVMYPKDFASHELSSLPEWTSVLHLASFFDFASLRQLAIDKLTELAYPSMGMAIGCLGVVLSARRFGTHRNSLDLGPRFRGCTNNGAPSVDDNGYAFCDNNGSLERFVSASSSNSGSSDGTSNTTDPPPLHPPSTSPIADLINLGLTYNVPQWLHPLYTHLSIRPEPLTLEEGRKLGVDVVVKINEVPRHTRQAPISFHFVWAGTATDEWNDEIVVDDSVNMATDSVDLEEAEQIGFSYPSRHTSSQGGRIALSRINSVESTTNFFRKRDSLTYSKLCSIGLPAPAHNLAKSSTPCANDRDGVLY
ncbi:hypothetical protein D9757_012862 [Collybiopsis confluens]|uniref:BTB domain-containing protein n=1 Tax=Collybiopsis confluens TaxID=2823264 RepID=A0A8H5G1M5_9AGAR|nr:hypothetical protein D9757_012862 [Collybiopsis confluens]